LLILYYSQALTKVYYNISLHDWLWDSTVLMRKNMFLKNNSRKINTMNTLTFKIMSLRFFEMCQLPF